MALKLRKTFMDNTIQIPNHKQLLSLIISVTKAWSSKKNTTSTKALMREADGTEFPGCVGV